MNQQTSTGVEPFRKARAVSLTTFRRDGRAVPTAVWFYIDGDKMFTTTHRKAGKLKRLANNSAIELAVCTQGGKVKGPVFIGTARLLNETETKAVLHGKQRRYRIHKLMMLLPSMKDQIGIEITPGSAKVSA
jgi:uncharacterized protein